MNRRGAGAGFTVIEVTVALVIGGLAVTAAVALVGALDERAGAIAAARLRVDREANAERLLRHLAGNLTLVASGPALRGDARSVSFHSWCDTPDGWLGRCDVRLAIADDERAVVLSLAGASNDTLTVVRSDRPITFRYLRDARERGTWVERWTDIVLPPAFAVVTDRDTLLLALARDG